MDPAPQHPIPPAPPPPTPTDTSHPRPFANVDVLSADVMYLPYIVGMQVFRPPLPSTPTSVAVPSESVAWQYLVW